MKINVVLFQPEIPQNTANIMRTCAGTSVTLHLIKPLGFKLDPKYLKRVAVNYLDNVDYFVYDSYHDFIEKNPGEYYFITRYGKKPPRQMAFQEAQKDIYLIFGRESTGLPKNILRQDLDRCVRLPMNDSIRSLNLANTVAIMVYEVLGQLDYLQLSKTEPETLKGEDWLLEE
ncbi:tRNA (cytidine(34)-2'-O)-methyltransferase [Hujiaoplasma nucleasis]|uniref:Putative tRNA (cytidine(34)-2'-O)-methyltransferase n=1 Tax=Hujiaoplasma nucleasis TaxID=2725268 RepID=A0A7L6N576_9MOLU|nr:tRNA (cytidine(34)-2'-O)-methyltransferase [Hujiaoplasma nucleasis]QLY39729.1 tRNA (cytidine(34)-2'-O)-methyltransferase [Hujiaoplasma nucleasis]